MFLAFSLTTVGRGKYEMRVASVENRDSTTKYDRANQVCSWEAL